MLFLELVDAALTLIFFLDHLDGVLKAILLDLGLWQIVIVWGQVDVLTRDLLPFVVFFKLLKLANLDQTRAVFTDVIINGVCDAFKSVLCIPAFVSVFVDDSLDSSQSLLLPLLDFARKLTRSAIRGWLSER